MSIYRSMLKVSKYTLPFMIAYKIISGIAWLEKDDETVRGRTLEHVIEQREPESLESNEKQIADALYETLSFTEKLLRYGRR